ncbi:MAG: anthranilate synthase component I family protein, partial [Flammeovirgaceae bacterium]|nr:anthranilate synthase component I family protein [Flammeovirgaceae bacterium]
MKITFQTQYRQMLADTTTPVSIYLKLRDRFAGCIMLESSDYHGNENSFSYICCQPIATFSLKGMHLEEEYPKGKRITYTLSSRKEALTHWQRFLDVFSYTQPPDFKCISHGLFGYITFDAVQYFDDIVFDERKQALQPIPDIHYQVFQFVIAIDHFRNELVAFEHLTEGEKSRLDELMQIINSKNYPSYYFETVGKETSNFSDDEFLKVIEKSREHCFLGDVFQIVPSRRFQQDFKGDEFNVYRCLRSINPSPYLFYFDYGNFKIFGSSPETQISIRNDGKERKASIFPIAGTYRRTGDDKKDAEMAQLLYNDPKENAEHVMLVDLARNDLSRNGSKVKVEVYKELQFYSHVIHLVSKVSGILDENIPTLRVVADTFPAGTLSGAPKYKAMQLIDKYENVPRGYYGGA